MAADRLVITPHDFQATVAALRAAGDHELEAFVLWAGALQGSVARVTNIIVPAQSASGAAKGFCVYVSGDELHRINMWLFENNKMLMAQVHSHPFDAYHSLTDDTFPLVTSYGAFSVVIPNFARGSDSLGGAAIYRLVKNGWQRLAGASQAIVIE